VGLTADLFRLEVDSLRLLLVLVAESECRLLPLLRLEDSRRAILLCFDNRTIARLFFTLGLRPFLTPLSTQGQVGSSSDRFL
jgi:hypothetical protein